jgi:hypothetical protein
MDEKKKCIDGCMNTTTNDIGIKTCEFDGRIITDISNACENYDDWTDKKDE